MSAASTFPGRDFRAQGVEMDFRSIFELSPLPAAHCDQNGIILQMNSAFEKLLNGKVGLGGRLSAGDVLASQDREHTNRLFREVLQGTRSAVQIEKASLDFRWNIWRGSGSTALLVGVPCCDPGKSPNPLQAERWEAVGRLTGGVVHDFNNLLTGVMLYCDLLLAGLDPGERRLRRYAEEIRGAVAQAAMLIRQLLVFARSKSASVRPVSFNQIAETMRDLLTRLLGENVELELRLDSRLVLAEIDWAQAEQILLNLILNGRDALPEGGRIVVETSNCKLEQVVESGRVFTKAPVFGGVLLIVSDNGCGIDAAARQRLFEPFYTTKTTGTGLGLTTVRSIVANNNGLIQVESEPGRGTRVLILLPQYVPDSSQTVSIQPVSNLPHLVNPTPDSPRTTLEEVK